MVIITLILRLLIIARKMIELIVQQVDEIKRLWKHKRQLIHQGLNLALVIISALMIWKGLTYLSKSEAPVVVVLSGSMEPAFQRGDILCLNNNVRLRDANIPEF